MAKKKLHRPILYYLLLAIRAVLHLLPYRVGFVIGGGIGRCVFRLLAKERERTLSHLRLAFGSDKSAAELQEIGRKMFEHYGRTVFELAMADKIIPRIDQFVSSEGYEHFEKAKVESKPVIVILAHFGNWELMGGYTVYKGYPGSVIARRIYYERYDKLLVDLRAKFGLKTIYRDDSVRRMLAILQEKGRLAFVADQDVDTVHGVFVDFFGRPAYTPVAPVRLAAATGAVMLPMFIIRDGTRHKVIVEPPLELVDTGNKEEDARINTQKWVKIQEKYIREYPHLWVWNHKRWKTTPETLAKRARKASNQNGKQDGGEAGQLQSLVQSSSPTESR